METGLEEAGLEEAGRRRRSRKCCAAEAEGLAFFLHGRTGALLPLRGRRPFPAVGMASLRCGSVVVL